MYKYISDNIKKSIGSRKGHTSIRKRLVTNYSMLICFLVIIIVIINLFITSNILMDRIGDYMTQAIGETREKVGSSLKKIEIAANILNNNSQIQQLVIAHKDNGGVLDDTEDIESVLGRDNIRRSLNDVINVIGDIRAIRIYYNENDALVFRGIRFIREQQPQDITEVLAELDQSRSKYVWMTPSEHEGKMVFSFAKRFIDTALLEKIGYILVDVDVRYLNSILTEGQTEELQSIYLVDRRQNVIGGSNGNRMEQLSPALLKIIADTETGTFNTVIDGVPMLVAYTTSAYTGWKVVGMASLDRLKSDILKNQAVIILIGLVGIVISFAVSALIANSITKPINKLRSTMRAIEQGSMHVDVEQSDFVEIEELAHGFKHMLAKTSELYTKAYNNELRKKEAEFSALQAQINPHFLYNTLETINYMLIIDGKYDISRLVANLGDLLRYSINKSNNIIALRQDLEQIEKYLYIQKVRFSEKLNYRFDIQPETQDCRILKLLIQPIVENAIYHGIEKKRGAGMLIISSAINDGLLTVSIEDDGVGMPVDVIAEVRSDDSDTEHMGRHTKLGINNINHRIKLFYGEEYGLKIASEAGKGTKVTICLPAIRKDGAP